MFPTEINCLIIGNIHPYYLINGYRKSSSITKYECDNNIYSLLKTWVHPELSVVELKRMFPDLTFSQLVHLSLIYNPIIELFTSKLNTILDHPLNIMHIFQHACRVNNMEVANYILDNISDIAKYSNDILTIAYYYNVNGLSVGNSSTLSLINNIVAVKLGGEVRETIILEFAELLLTESKTNLLWKLEDRAEFICILNLMVSEPLTVYQQMIGVSYDSNSIYHMLANLLGIDKLSRIVKKYAPFDEITLYPEVVLEPNIDIFFEYYPEMNFGKLLLQPHLAPKYITMDTICDMFKYSNDVNESLREYYLLSGNYEYYLKIAWKSKHIYTFGTILASTDILGRVITYYIDINTRKYEFLSSRRIIQSVGVEPTSTFVTEAIIRNYPNDFGIFELTI